MKRLKGDHLLFGDHLVVRAHFSVFQQPQFFGEKKTTPLEGGQHYPTRDARAQGIPTTYVSGLRQMFLKSGRACGYLSTRGWGRASRKTREDDGSATC